MAPGGAGVIRIDTSGYPDPGGKVNQSGNIRGIIRFVAGGKVRTPKNI